MIALTKGILCYSNQEYEWLIPWWLQNIRRFSSLPIAVVDLSLSNKMKKWCKEAGLTLLRFNKPKQAHLQKPTLKQRQKWEKNYFGDLWKLRDIWFFKPYILLASPFQQTLYLDLDCQVIGAFDCLLEEKTLFGICPEPTQSDLYNSGVILYRHNSSILDEWALRSMNESHLYMGDENLLSDILIKNTHLFKSLDPQYNCRPHHPLAKEASIIHWVGAGGKRDILASILEQRAFDHLNPNV